MAKIDYQTFQIIQHTIYKHKPVPQFPERGDPYVSLMCNACPDRGDWGIMHPNEFTDHLILAVVDAIENGAK